MPAGSVSGVTAGADRRSISACSPAAFERRCPKASERMVAEFGGFVVGFGVDVVEGSGEGAQVCADAVGVVECMAGADCLAVELFVVGVEGDGVA